MFEPRLTLLTHVVTFLSVHVDKLAAAIKGTMRQYSFYALKVKQLADLCIALRGDLSSKQRKQLMKASKDLVTVTKFTRRRNTIDSRNSGQVGDPYRRVFDA